MRELDIFPARASAARLEALRERRAGAYTDYGRGYFDEPGGVYGGYWYDGRYADAAKKLVEAFGLKPGDTVLELGCAKGFVLVELQKLGLDVRGIDASGYAVENAHKDVRDRIEWREAGPYLGRGASFDFVFAKELLPHLTQYTASSVAAEMTRVGKQAYVVIQCAANAEAAALMKQWDPTHRICKPREWWRKRLQSAGYQGAVSFKELF